MPRIELINAKQAANLLGIAKCTVYRWFEQGLLGGRHYPTGTVRISRDSVEELIAKSTTAPLRRHASHALRHRSS